jgi:hypothetical protein
MIVNSYDPSRESIGATNSAAPLALTNLLTRLGKTRETRPQTGDHDARCRLVEGPQRYVRDT